MSFDTLQKNYQMIFLHLGKKYLEIQTSKPWAPSTVTKLRTITSSGSGDTLAVSRVDQTWGYHRVGTWNSGMKDFETFGSFLVGGFSWVEIPPFSVWKLYSLELLALAVHLHLPLASSARKHILQLHSLLFIVFSLLSFCCISVCWNIVHPLHVDHIYVYI